MAFKTLQERDRQLWREGQGQLKQYLIDLKDGKLGDGPRARYFVVFPKEDVEKSEIFVKQPKV